MRKFLVPTVVIVVAAFTTGAFAAMAPTKIGHTTKGNVLTNALGMTLYTFAKDPKGKSMCNGKCAHNWPPFLAAAGAKPEGKYTLITRADGHKQWAYMGKPLYTFIKDKKPGQIMGNGLLHGAWHIAKS